MIRLEAGMSTARWCERFDIPERTWRRWQAKAKAGGRPVLDIPAEVLAEIRRQFPGREGRYQREKERRKWRAIEKLKAERLRIARRLRLTNFTDETALAHALAHALRES